MKRVLKVIVPIIIIILVAFIFYYSFLRKQLIKEVSIIKDEEKYYLKIDYPILYNSKIDNKIKTYVNNKQEEFMKIVNKDKITHKYELLIQTEVHKNNDILYITVLNNTYTGGAHYIKDYYNLYYDIKEDKLIDITHFFKDDKSFNELYKLTHYYVKDYFDKNNKSFDENWIRKGTEPKLENYSYFTFTNQGIQIIFKPYQVAPYSEGEIKIIIPYDDLKGVIKDKYLTNKSVKKEDKLIPEVRDSSKYKDKKLLAFTFDDGPNTETTKILLDSLNKYDAKVTFFILGNRINRHSEILKRAYLEGNQIGSHTYNHRNLKILSNESALNEINSTNMAIKSVIGVNPSIIRPPYGNINYNIDMKMPTILWNIDTLDWKYKDKNIVADKIVEKAHDGAIILLHDIYKSSVEGALLAMERLKDEYYFVTIEEMAILKNKKLENNQKYFNIK